MFFLIKRTSLPPSDKQDEEDHEDGRRRRGEREGSRALSHSPSSLSADASDLSCDSATSKTISEEISSEEKRTNRNGIVSEGEREETKASQKTEEDKTEGMKARMIGRNSSFTQNREGML